MVTSGFLGSSEGLNVRGNGHKLLRDHGELPRQLRADIWQQLLEVNIENTDMVGFEEVRLDESNQRVIKNDCERTRGSMAEFRNADRVLLMEELLTFFCKKHNIKYKQGINEILAPFLHLVDHDPKVTIPHVYGMFSQFQRMFLANVFRDDNFHSLQCSFFLFHHLLMYHFPELALFLRQNQITPEIFTTPWFLTLFASKTDMQFLMMFWDHYIVEGDINFFVYFAVALVKERERRIRDTERSGLPEVLSQIKIENDRFLREVWLRAVDLRSCTPSSFTQRMAEAKACQDHDTLAKVESEEAFFIHPQEAIQYCLAASDTPRTNLKLFLVDLRPQWQFDAGHVPPAIHLDLSMFVSEDDYDWKSWPQAEIWQYLKDKLGSMINNQHIALVGRRDCSMTSAFYKMAVRMESGTRYISIVEGGYEGLHELAETNHMMELVDHDPQWCVVCNCKADDIMRGERKRNSFMTQIKKIATNVKDTGVSMLKGPHKSEIPKMPPMLYSEVLARGWPMYECRLATLISDGELREYPLTDDSSSLPPIILIVTAKHIVVGQVLNTFNSQGYVNGEKEVDVWGQFGVKDVFKITSKKFWPNVICFYFNTDHTRPLLILRLASKDSAQGAISHVREQYRALKDAEIRRRDERRRL